MAVLRMVTSFCRLLIMPCMEVIRVVILASCSDCSLSLFHVASLKCLATSMSMSLMSFFFTGLSSPPGSGSMALSSSKIEGTFTTTQMMNSRVFTD